MAEYEVTLPISGYVYLTVEAESEDQAIRKALSEEVRPSEIEEWSTLEAVVTGNVWYGIGSPRARAEKVDD